ncbi:MAG: response regulator transcription factor [Gemmatimonadaceae bacterium]
MSGPIRVVLVDDHAVVREGVRQVLLADSGFEVVGEAATARAALEVVGALAPDVVLLDINLPDDSGLRVAARIREAHPDVRVLMLSVNDDREFVLEGVHAGAHGYLRKDTTPADLRAAVRAVNAGDAYFSPGVARHLTDALRSSTPPSGSPSPMTAALAELTNREREVLLGIARGQMNKEIGAELGISVRTVESHRDSLMRKLQLRSPAALTRFAIESGLLKGEGAP